MRTESGRWYRVSPKIECVQEITGKNGKPRKPNIKDAAENGWFPSVTTVMQIKDKPGLMRWKLGQMLMAAATLPREKDETDDAWIDRVFDDAEELSNEAAETGKDFHAALDEYWKIGKTDNEDKAIAHAIAQVQAWRIEVEKRYPCIMWSSETPYFNERLGICGTPDLSGNIGHTIVVVDYKTTDLKKYKEPYDEWAMQIAAGTYSLGRAKATWLGFEIVIDRTTGECLIRKWTDAEIDRGWLMLVAANNLWKLANRWEERKLAK